VPNVRGSSCQKGCPLTLGRDLSRVMCPAPEFFLIFGKWAIFCSKIFLCSGKRGRHHPVTPPTYATENGGLYTCAKDTIWCLAQTPCRADQSQSLCRRCWPFLGHCTGNNQPILARLHYKPIRRVSVGWPGQFLGQTIWLVESLLFLDKCRKIKKSRGGNCLLLPQYSYAYAIKCHKFLIYRKSSQAKMKHQIQ